MPRQSQWPLFPAERCLSPSPSQFKGVDIVSADLLRSALVFLRVSRFCAMQIAVNVHPYCNCGPSSWRVGLRLQAVAARFITSRILLLLGLRLQLMSACLQLLYSGVDV
jgi:hypothetical protein